ncbi:FtsX-like permease family protein [Rhodocytophaga rosea]|uniref:FtsX-like permease family protein n=1 Tax=Rhodocytophaga rosea TaxID=2704465 RepID=A0A6C0GH26_9BACT|nr:ABC transporter permease [Rhodocytophaga rosea]QHT67267.1 FtsX-like permease family protein [Rhodocytophaga rosea]
MYKQRLFAIFNILGISMGIACCIVVYLFIYHLYSQDAFHRNAASIFMVNHVRTVNNQPELWTPSPAALAPALQMEVAQVKRVVRFHNIDAVVKYGRNLFHQQIHLADADFFNMFSFPLQEGNAQVLNDPSAIVLSHEMAIKYFGREQAMGKLLTVSVDGTFNRTFKVMAVAAPFPNTASFSFDMLINYTIGKHLGWQDQSWKQQVKATFIELNSPVAAHAVTQSLSKYVKLHNQINPQSPISAFYLDNLRDVSLHAHKTRHAFSSGTSPTAMWVLGILASLVLLMACFNFMNYTIATSNTRFKEIGVRKVLGSNRKLLICQFIGENLLTACFALAVALLLVDALFLPAFSRMIDFYSLRFHLLDNWKLIAFLFLLLVGISLVSGLYPSLYISSFHPVSILKGNERIKNNLILTRTLLVWQFGLSMFTVAAAILTTQNAQFLRRMDVGYDQTRLLVLQAPTEGSFNQLRNAAVKFPNVVGVAGSRDQVGQTKDNSVLLEYKTATTAVELINVSAGYMELLKFRLIEGRRFLPDSHFDADNAIIVNESLVMAMGWSQGVGKRIRLQEQSYQIVGVVKDFNYRFFMLKIAPCVLKLNAPQENRVLTMKINSGDITAVSDYMKAHWQKVIPDLPFEMFQQEDVYSASYDESRRIKDVFTYVALLTLLISAMGLYALIALTIAKKTKEIGIRKVLGASAWNIARLVNQEFLFVITLAGILFLPLAFFLLRRLLDQEYAYHIPVTAGVFISTLGVMLVVTIITISIQVFKIATSNPVKALRTE